MASLIHLDTHAVVWLAAGEWPRLPPFLKPLVQGIPCAVSPMVLLELDYLHEIGRLRITADAILQILNGAFTIETDGSTFAKVAAEAAKLTWTRDPFDRLICANARVSGARLLTKDKQILANEPAAFWDQPPT